MVEILRSTIPLYRALGIDASWLVMEGDESFFNVTKHIHNALQGNERYLSASEWDSYLAGNHSNVAALSQGYDVVFVHDPQLAAIRQFAPVGTAQRWVWRCHIDTSTPNSVTWQSVSDLVNEYDAAVFSIPEFVGPGLRVPHVAVIPPAIDPLTPKNRPMSHKRAIGVVRRYGVDTGRPFITQVSRFDPWKDPLGVIAAFEELRKRHPSLQLVLLGNFADDDPEGQVMYAKVLEAALNVPDVHIITGLTDLVNPFQALSKVVLQKSLREGFGLTVAEALWKRTPVVARNVGGIRLQIEDGVGGFLVDSVEECSQKVDYLLSHEDVRLALGEAGRERVRSQFLTPRLLRDEMLLVKSLLESEQASSRIPASHQAPVMAAD